MANPNDGGIASLDGSSKDVTPEKPKSIVGDVSDDNEDFDDGTFCKRLKHWPIIGLSKLFPESAVKFTAAVGSCTKAGVKGLYNFSRNTLWIMASSALILFAPLMFEVERATLLALQESHSQQKQFLLGPNAMSGSTGKAPSQ